MQAKQLLDASQEWIDSQQKRQRLRDAQIRKFKEFLDWCSRECTRVAGSWGFYSVSLATVLGLGWIIGLNTPQISVCGSSEDLCYRLRFRSPKLTINDLPRSQCKAVAKGLLCEVKPHETAESKSIP